MKKMLKRQGQENYHRKFPSKFTSVTEYLDYKVTAPAISQKTAPQTMVLTIVSDLC